MKLTILVLMSELVDRESWRPRRLFGLFEEALRRQRRRHVRVGLVAFTALIAVAVLIRVNESPVDHGSPSRAVTQLTSAGVPASGNFASLAHVAGRLIIAGGPGGQPLDVSGAATTLVHGRASGQCTAATIAPGTVRLQPLRHANCGDPALYGLSVLPIMFLEHRPRDGQVRIGVRIAVADRGARDGYRLGPTVMSYAECSDCGAQWIIGDGSLWINGPFASGNHHPGVLLRISSTTGRVLQRFSVPQLLRALLAVNQNGLWVAPSVETGSPGLHLSRRVQREYASLYLISPGATRPEEVLHVGRDGVDWLAAAGDHVWLEDHPTPSSSDILTFTGTHPSDGRETPRRAFRPGTPDEFGEGAVPYAATPTGGVDAILAPTNGRQQIININPTTLAEHVLASVPRTDAYDEAPAAATQGHAAYFLDPRLTGAAAVTPARLYRVDQP